MTNLKSNESNAQTLNLAHSKVIEKTISNIEEILPIYLASAYFKAMQQSTKNVAYPKNCIIIATNDSEVADNINNLLLEMKVNFQIKHNDIVNTVKNKGTPNIEITASFVFYLKSINKTDTSIVGSKAMNLNVKTAYLYESLKSHKTDSLFKFGNNEIGSIGDEIITRHNKNCSYIIEWYVLFEYILNHIEEKSKSSKPSKNWLKIFKYFLSGFGVIYNISNITVKAALIISVQAIVFMAGYGYIL